MQPFFKKEFYINTEKYEKKVEVKHIYNFVKKIKKCLTVGGDGVGSLLFSFLKISLLSFLLSKLPAKWCHPKPPPKSNVGKKPLNSLP